MQSTPESSVSRAPGLGSSFVLGLLLLLACGLDALACRASGPVGLAPVPVAASEALASARVEERLRGDGWRGRAQAAARRSLALAPEWVAPRRLLDDLARGDLLGSQALTEHLDGLREASGDARLLYLAGRLEGADGLQRFEQARRLLPQLAWAHHGAAWLAFQSGDAHAALRAGREATRRARDPWERSYFAIAEARYELALERPEAAVKTLTRVAAEQALAAHDQASLSVWLARAEMASRDDALFERGFWRGIDLLEGGSLSESELFDLGDMLAGGVERIGYGEALASVEAALAARAGPGREALRARFLIERGANAAALALWERASERSASASGPTLLAEALRVGEPADVIEGWRASLPAQVVGADGVPRRASLARLVAAASATLEAQDAVGARRAFANALFEAGWFRELRAYAPRLAADDLDFALEVDARGAAGEALLGGVRRLLERIDTGEPYGGPRGAQAADTNGSAAGAEAIASDPPASPAPIEDLDQLLAAMQALFDRYHGFASEREAEDLRASPRLSYGSLAAVVHPGPRFSDEDAREERGPVGEEVGGLARELLALGRFGIFGESLGGGGPDGSILRLLAIEERSGEHLGVAFAGTVAWCESTEVPSRPVRRGASITGAALHEGYWIDVQGIRREHERWLELEREFFGEADARELAIPLPARVERALDALGPPLPAHARPWERTRLYAASDEAQRVRLRVLSERESADAATLGHARGGRVTLEELLELTALHEEGHLTDRSRFLPITKRPLAAFGLFVDAGFSPAGVARLLEYRAQLVALCDAQDPRMALADCLDGVDGSAGVTPHAAAYRELLVDWLRVLEDDFEVYAALDPERYWVHQLHRLESEEVRAISLELARRKGMLVD